MFHYKGGDVLMMLRTWSERAKYRILYIFLTTSDAYKHHFLVYTYRTTMLGNRECKTHKIGEKDARHSV